MFCGKCGKEIEDDALTCKYCGASTEEELDEMDDQPTIGLDEMIAHQEARKATEKKEEAQPENQKVPLAKPQPESAAQAGAQNGQQVNQQPSGQNGPQPNSQNGPQPGTQGNFQARPKMGGPKAFQAGPQMGGPNGPQPGQGPYVQPQQMRQTAPAPMPKAALGVSIGILAAATYWTGLISDLVAILLIGYILIKEEDNWLRSVALKAGIIIVGMAAITTVTGFFTQGVNGFNALLNLFDRDQFYNTVLGRIGTLLDYICLIVKDVVLLIAGYQAFRYQDFRIGFIDRIVYNHLGTKSK